MSGCCRRRCFPPRCACKKYRHRRFPRFFRALKVHSCPRHLRVALDLGRKWTRIPQCVQCQGQLFHHETDFLHFSPSLSLSSVLFFVHCTRARRVSRVRVSIGFRGSRNVSRVACTFERGIRTEKSDSERLTGAICCVSCVCTACFIVEIIISIFFLLLFIICRENLN